MFDKARVERQQIIDCGTFSAVHGFPRSECPSYPDQVSVLLWHHGYTIGQIGMTATAYADLIVRKTLASQLEPDLSYPNLQPFQPT